MAGGYTIIVHGGAASYPGYRKKICVESLIEVAKEGLNAMKEQDSAVAGVVAAVKSMEDNPLFNAGYGSCLNEDGKVEMDAMVIDGHKMKYGAVASVQIVKNPVLLALNVMNSTPHCILVAEGAHKFAKSLDIPLCVDPDTLITDSQRKIFLRTPRFQDWLESDMWSNANDPSEDTPNDFYNHDTVGCVALDSRGRLACAGSTGGINGKQLGRVGDSCIIGAGGYATEKGAAVATGHGEAFLKAIACGKVVSYIGAGMHPSEAVVKVLASINKQGSKGGLISINKRGEIGHCYTTQYMPWVAIKSDGEIITSMDTPNPQLH